MSVPDQDIKIPSQMTGVVLTRHGGPDVLELRDDIAVPSLGPDEVLIRVTAAGVNNTDINTRTGWYARAQSGSGDQDGGWGGALAFPRIQGGDICGRVLAVGNDVETFEIGQRVTCPTVIARPTPDIPTGCIVLGSEFDGAFAQYCKIEARDLFDVSASPLSDIEIAAIPCAFGTAENMLCRVDLRAGQRVLISGASGGVGLAAVQLAKLRGAVVTGICSQAKTASLVAAGAVETFERGAPIPGSMFDVVIDVVGGPQWPEMILALKPAGQYAIAGAIAGAIVEADLREIYLRDITLHGCTYQPREVFAGLVERINSGDIRPLVSKTYPLEKISVAQQDFVSKTYAGKLVLIPGSKDEL